MSLIDTHFHLDCYRNHNQIFNTINKLEQYTLCVTNSPGVFLSCLRLYKETKYIKFALGVNPKEVINADIINDFKYCFNDAKYIGEVGLDFSKPYLKNKQVQIDVFNEIISVSKNKVLSIHAKNCEDILVDILKFHNPSSCIIHWFSGNSTQMNKLVDLGCYFSINPNMCNSAIIKSIPADKILIESDGPFSKLANKKFIPDMLSHYYSFIENKIEINNLEEVVYSNFSRLLKKKKK